MFCEKCGKQIETGAKFCPCCGYAFQQAPATDTMLNEAPEVSSAPVKSDTPAKKKGGKGKAIIIALVVLIIAAAGAVAAIFFLGDKGQQPDNAVAINRDHLLYAKDNCLYLTYNENNETILLSDDFYYYGMNRYIKENIPGVTYYNEATGYLYFPHEISADDYIMNYKLSRIKLDPDNIDKYEVETVVDEWIGYGKDYSVSPDDSLILYFNTNGDFYYKNLGTDEEAQRLEKNVERAYVDFEKNNCYYNDETEVTYLNLETMEKKIVFSSGADGYMYMNYAGDCVIVHAYNENYLIDKNGDKTYISSGNGYIDQVEDRYYFISNDYDSNDYGFDASLFVEDDCYEADSKIGENDSEYWGRIVRDEIREIVRTSTVYSYACDDIYLIEGNEAKLIADNVASYSQAGTVPAGCYRYPAPSKLVTISEIYDEILRRYYDMYSPYDINDYYVTTVIDEAYTKEQLHYIVVGDVLNEIKAEGLNYIADNLWFSDNYVYFEMSIGSYTDENGYEMNNSTKIYRAPVNGDNTLGQYELVSGVEGGITFLSGDNVFHHGKLEENGQEYYEEWYWYTYCGNLYMNDELIDSDVSIVYADVWSGDSFNKYGEGCVLYVKNSKESDRGTTADLYFYNGAEAVKLEKQISDYELSDGETAYYLDEGDFIRYNAEENITIDSGVDFIFKAELNQSALLGW